MPHAFSDDERVAAKGDGDVVVPTRKATALVVVEPELSLQILVDTLGSPALHDEADELLFCHAALHGDEDIHGVQLPSEAPGSLWSALRGDAEGGQGVGAEEGGPPERGRHEGEGECQQAQGDELREDAGGGAEAGRAGSAVVGGGRSAG